MVGKSSTIVPSAPEQAELIPSDHDDAFSPEQLTIE
jgi:hypothetical protein